MSTSSHPRRTPARNDPSSLIDSLQNMSLRKGDTFSPTTNTSKSSFWDPLEARATYMPVRSETSPKSLEDLLIGSGERRIAQLLNRVDKAVAANSKVALGKVLSEPEVLPLPNFMVNRASVSQKTRTRHHSHSSDSGLGSSIADSTESASTAKQSVRTVRSAPATVNQSFSSISDAGDQERGLSKYAADQIHKHIVKPILREESLKDFHDLIKSVPLRIGKKEIKNLRDLEKTLIFLAPDYSGRSPSKYLRFCEVAIRSFHTTVTTLHDSDQRAPTDRPYTQGYFFDLVEQIRRYATILAATRDAQAKSEQKTDAMDTSDEHNVSIHGGVSHGKPAELIYRNEEGQAISLATGQPISEEELASASMKRPAEHMDDDDALRSMARRKKNAKPEIHTCDLCSKEFKRPCDLTKHVKTHERPWKCPTKDCKYHEYGWPTEKERDRHVNDKHSSAPSLYHCLFKACPYTSKRESNCKQHMEKAHGWNYVRSKSNGKGRATSATRLPQGSIPPSPSSVMLTPSLTPIAPSPSIHSVSTSSRHGSMAPPPSAGPSTYGTPASHDFNQHFNFATTEFDFNDMQNFPTNPFPVTPAMSDERRDSESLSATSGMQYDASSFGDHSPIFMFGTNEFTMPTPEDYQTFTPNSSVAGPSSAIPHASPGAHMEQMFTDDAVMGHSYDNFTSGPTEDFTLFGAGAPSAAGDMFPTLDQGNWGNLTGNYGSHFENANNPPTLPTSHTEGDLEALFPELANKN